MTQKKTATTPTRGVQTTRDLTTPEGLDREIDILRELIHKAAAKQSDDLSLEEQLELLDTVGKTAPALARLLKARRDLNNLDLDPAALLRQALLELEEEWPEFRSLGRSSRTGEKRGVMCLKRQIFAIQLRTACKTSSRTTNGF